jgi:hypothetical protein
VVRRQVNNVTASVNNVVGVGRRQEHAYLVQRDVPWDTPNNQTNLHRAQIHCYNRPLDLNSWHLIRARCPSNPAQSLCIPKSNGIDAKILDINPSR